MKKVILLTEDEYNDLLLFVNHILVYAKYLLDSYHSTEIKRQTKEIKEILEMDSES